MRCRYLMYPMMILVVTVCVLPFSPTAHADTQWVDVTDKVNMDISNPVRSRRNPDAQIFVTITNTSDQPLAKPLRLVLSDLTSTVSLQNPSGTTADGAPYVLLDTYISSNELAPGASTSTFSMVILAGGLNLFSFNPSVEQEITIPTGPVDTDGDGFTDDVDAFPNDPTEWSDLDGDGIGDNSDPDRDNDGISNDYEQQAGTDPNDPNSVPPDLDGDGIPDSLDDDRDGDGVANNEDTFPDDASRFQLEAVNGIQVNLQNTHVRIEWQPLTDTTNLQGYSVYRQVFSETTKTKLNTGNISSVNYTDTTVQNGAGYMYSVVAVDTNGKEGAQGSAVNFFVAYNNTPVTALSVQRQGEKAKLDWSSPDVRFQLYRGVSGSAVTAYTQLDSAGPAHTYTDLSTSWNQSYQYQVAGIKVFSDVFSGAVLHVEGPRSVTQNLAQVAQISLSIENATTANDGALEVPVDSGDQLAITGRINNMIGVSSVTATSGSSSVSSKSTDGTIKFLLPLSHTDWTVTVTEDALPTRTVTTALRLVVDTTPPEILIEGGLNRSINTDDITIAGTATDTQSTVTEIIVTSDRYAGIPFGVVRGGAGGFTVDVPLEPGKNIVTVFAKDSRNNVASTVITVDRAVPLSPTIVINSPVNGGSVLQQHINVQGIVYSALNANDIRLNLGNQELFPTPSGQANTFSFSFNNIALKKGVNTLTVAATTPVGKVSRSVLVNYVDQTTAQQTPAPTINITQPVGRTYFNTPNVIIAGSVSSAVGVTALTVNGSNVALQGTGATRFFETEINISALVSPNVSIVATDILNKSTTKILVIKQDAQPPVINITSSGIVIAPDSNRVVEIPFPLSGQITENNLAGFTINGQVIALVPGASANQFEFNALLNLPNGDGQILKLEAWDLANNRVSQEIILDVSPATGIEIITPKNNAEIAASSAGTSIDVLARLSNPGAGTTVNVTVGNLDPQPMTLDANLARSTLVTALTEGKHTISILVNDAAGELIAKTSSTITLINTDTKPLEVERTEPVNNDRDIATNQAITVYFTKPIDKSLLQINVKQTVHGLDYDLSNQKNVGFGELPEPQLVEIHKDMETVDGVLASFPGDRFISFQPAGAYFHNADVFVEVKYDNRELSRFSFKVKSIPTIVSGGIMDHLGTAVEGVRVTLPQLKASTKTTSNGSFQFKLEADAQINSTGGRYNVVVNPDMENPLYGTVTQFADIRAERLNDIRHLTLPLINQQIPFEQINSGQNPVVIGQGNVTLDLSEARVIFPNGRSQGQVHVQMIQGPAIPYSFTKNAIPQWLFGLQASGTSVEGNVGVSIVMPALYGTLDYIPTDGSLVIMLGFNPINKILEPVGLGKINNNIVQSIGKLPMRSLDYIGYAFVFDDLQPILKRYESGEISSLVGFRSALENAGN